MHFHEELKSWRKVEQDMRAAGYPETRIQKAKESYYQGIYFLRRMFQRTFSNDDKETDTPVQDK